MGFFFFINIYSARCNTTKPASRGYIHQKPFITPRERESEQILFTMMGDGSPGSWSRNTIHYSYRHCNNSNGSSEEEGIEVSLGEESRGHRYLDTSQFSSSNCGGRESFGRRSQETSHSTSSNYGGCGYR